MHEANRLQSRKLGIGHRRLMSYSPVTKRALELRLYAMTARIEPGGTSLSML
ncbi:MAG: hypothetical protein JWN22_874 [Nocardioides sp.]|jgi:hypothetical protein|nr:hypothetical protein [Nocardioides sp.]